MKKVYNGFSPVTYVPNPNAADGQNGSSGGASAGATFGNYGGAAPNFIPASGTGMAVDTSTQNLWVYDNSGWHQLV